MGLTLHDVRCDGHMPSYSREQAGKSPFGGQMYATSVRCECGWRWEGRYAGATKGRATTAHNDHLRDVRAKAAAS